MLESGAIDSKRTSLFDKIWEAHRVESVPGGPDVLAIDLHLLHESTSPEAFAELERRGLSIAHPERTIAVADHMVPTSAGAAWTELARDMVTRLAGNTARHHLPFLGFGNARQGIVHVIGPELGLTLPGATIVCGDSHTSTHGALGALAFGIGTSQVAHVLATQALLVDRPRTMLVRVDGTPSEGVTSKDIALALISRYGNQFGSGHAIEFAGPTVTAMSVEQRMTLCNMSIEFGARMGLVAPDDTTVDYLAQRPYRLTGAAWDAALAGWSTLPSDPDATFDTTIDLPVAGLRPYVTWGTTPAQAMELGAAVPDPTRLADASARELAERALHYMDVRPGSDLRTLPIDVAFIGSCTNGRIEDLRAAATVLRGRRVAARVRAIVVPGSGSVRAQAEREGLDEVFRAAGFDWGTASCSLCVAANGDVLAAGTRAASSTNRNFEGRQGTGARTHLMSPACVAASAVAGHLASPADLT